MAATSMPAGHPRALDILRAGGTHGRRHRRLRRAMRHRAASTGIGGDCFCLYVPAGSSKVVALNGSGRAPAAATPEHCAPPASPPWSTPRPIRDGARAISAWELLNRTHGRLGLDRNLQAAIAYAEEGFPSPPRVAWDWASGVGQCSPGTPPRPAASWWMARHPPRHPLPPAGARPHLPPIAAKGKRANYEGEVAADIVATLRAAGGCTPRRISPAAPTSPNSSRPISIGWRGMEVFQCPPNGVGMHVLQILGTLGNLETPEGGPGSALRFHRHIEAARFAYRDRDAFLADPSQADVPVAKLLDAGI